MIKKKKKLSPAKKLYLFLVAVMVILAIIALLSVKSLLIRYERCQPERRVEELIGEWKTDARAGTIWNRLDFPSVTGNEYEPADLKEYYNKALASGLLQFSMVPGSQTEDGQRTYAVKTDDGQTIADVKLRAVGEPETHLGVFTLQDWTVEDAELVVKPQTYTVEAPDELTVYLNGIELGEDERTDGDNGFACYTVDGLCLIPEVRLRTPDGQPIKTQRSGTKFRAQVYSYSLTLPEDLKVSINGQEASGEPLGDGTVSYRAFSETKQFITLCDSFGNSFDYMPGTDVPMTNCVLTVEPGSFVMVNGKVVAPTLAEKIDIPEKVLLAPYVSSLPQNERYTLTILQDNAAVSVRDITGKVREIEDPNGEIDLTNELTGEDIPYDISAEIDVLKTIETWSLFMSTDLDGQYYGIGQITPYLIEGSELYQQAYNWINSIDITFISIHTLADPAFTGESVTNFRRVTNDCFFCDVKFDKNMLIQGNNWEPLFDRMNTRVCFVRVGGEWKLLQMKEIV